MMETNDDNCYHRSFSPLVASFHGNDTIRAITEEKMFLFSKEITTRVIHLLRLLLSFSKRAFSETVVFSKTQLSVKENNKTCA